MANSNLAQAKSAKNDEFYTQWADIEREVQAYLEYNPDVFRSKTILCPCDDPEWSNFIKFFALHFQEYGLKKLISTSFAVDSKAYQEGYQISFFEQSAPQFDADKTCSHGKIFILEETDISSDGIVNIDDLQWDYLDGDGDFRSDECIALLQEADIVITNPPFSLFREYVAQLMEYGKQFLIIGTINAITYKEIFPLIKEDRMWMGYGFQGGNAYFRVSGEIAKRAFADGVYNPETGLVKFRNCCWFTNLDHGRRHQSLPLMTMADNLKFSKHKEIRGRAAYDRYDNYDAIEVPFTDAIPSDYDGVMGVPISFLDKYCYTKFEILGMTQRDNIWGLQTKTYTPQDSPKYGDMNRRSVIRDGDTFLLMYARLLIRRRNACAE